MNLALNQAAKIRNVLRGVQQVDEPTACIEKLRRGLTSSNGRRVRRRLRRLNLLSAQNLSDYWHFELEDAAEIGRLLTWFNDLADDWQIERRQQESARVAHEGGPAKV